MIVKTARQHDLLLELGGIAKFILNELHAASYVGITTKELDRIAGELMKEYDVESAPIKAYEFPGHTCISINEVVAHGIPDNYALRECDMVNIDVSLTRDDIWVDTGRSEVVGDPTPEQANLLEAVLQARSAAVRAVKPGKPYVVVAQAVEKVAARYGVKVLENLGGHGTGSALHTPPYLANVQHKAEHGIFKPGQVVAIEPLLSYQDKEVRPSGTWHLVTRTQAVQAEHTIIVRKNAEILT